MPRMAGFSAVLWVALTGAVPAGATELVPAAGAAVLRVVDEAGAVLFETALARDARWCLVWNHSVTGIEVRDCFRHDDGRMVLERSRQPDFAAGLGHTPGRGVQVSDGAGGYWIEAMNVAMPGDELPLRVGGPRVDHRLLIGNREVSLSALAAGRRVTLSMDFPPGEAR